MSRTFAADEFAFIAQRLKENEETRRQVLNNTKLPETPIGEAATGWPYMASSADIDYVC